MFRTCNGADPNLKTLDGQVGACGRTFDDVNHWTTCPHDEFAINPDVRRLLDEYEPFGLVAPVDLGGDTQPIVPGDPAATDPAGAMATCDKPGHDHSGSSCQGPTDPAGTDRQRIVAAVQRYLVAVHAVQSGVAFMMQLNSRIADPKHLRVGIDTGKFEQGALVKLLIDRGVFTEAEYSEAVADAAEAEVRRTEEELSKRYRRPVTLA